SFTSSSIFLFNCHRDYLDLHSFPTRRSSDLVKKGKMLKRNMRREYLTEEELTDHLRLEGIDDVAEVKAAYVEGDGKISVIARRRSEEHTSELQSRENLVCRLLLEKKKKKLKR